jgi:hypothetical protein
MRLRGGAASTIGIAGQSAHCFVKIATATNAPGPADAQQKRARPDPHDRHDPEERFGGADQHEHTGVLLGVQRTSN